jgi:GNAT superfamily N-acetyltransferase
MNDVAAIACRFPREEDLEPAAIRHVSDLVNRVYDVAESGMWRAQGVRTNPSQIAALLRAKELVLAECRGVVVGCVNVKLLEPGITEFGMLVADPACRGLGIGSALIEFAERWARAMQCRVMRLELLTPRKWSHPSKEFLKQWYSRLGYRPQFTEPLEKLYPELAPQLATECDFTVWHKAL